MVEKITDRQSMIAWAKRVEQNGGIKEKCLRQDEWGRSSSKDVEEAYKALDSSELRAVSCAIYNVLDMDVLWEMIRTRAKHLAHKEQEDMFREYEVWQDKQNTELSSRLHEILDKEHAYSKTEQAIKDMEEEVKFLKTSNDSLMSKLRISNQQVDRYREKADKYDALKALLA